MRANSEPRYKVKIQPLQVLHAARVSAKPQSECRQALNGVLLIPLRGIDNNMSFDMEYQELFPPPGISTRPLPVP